MALNLVRRFERAGDMLVHFDLDRHMADAEALVQLMRELDQKFVAGMTARHQAMTGQSGVGRAHRPNMQIVDRGNARLCLEKRTDLVGLDPGWNRVERHADAVAQQAPCARQNDPRDCQDSRADRAASSR